MPIKGFGTFILCINRQDINGTSERAEQVMASHSFREDNQSFMRCRSALQFRSQLRWIGKKFSESHLALDRQL